MVNGWYTIEKSKSYVIKENDYVHLHCNECDYIYRTGKKITIFKTNNAYELYFTKIGSNILYIEDKQQILKDNNYYLDFYYLPKNECNGYIYIGYDKEIINYLFSQMTEYKNLYDEEKSKNSNEIDQIKIDYNKKVNKLINEAKALKNEFQNKENLSKTEKAKLTKKLEETHLENIKLQKENDKFKKRNMALENFGIRYNTENGEGDYDIVPCIDSIKNLTNGGWVIKYNKKEGKALYEESKQRETIFFGVVGNGNKGKSFLLKNYQNTRFRSALMSKQKD